MSDALEIEVKYYLTDVVSTRSKIVKLGGKSCGRVFETNIRFEDDKNSFIQNKSLLRLRKDKKTTLTFKSPPYDNDKRYKILRELEVEINDFDTMVKILNTLGFHEEQIYEKWRETYHLHNAIVCIDSMPYGNFIEIEASKIKIKDITHRIGLRWDKRILLNYLEIFEIIKKIYDINENDLTFENLEDKNIDLKNLLHMIESGTREFLPGNHSSRK